MSPFANLTDGTAQNRQFDLYVGNGGFETGDFTDWNFVGDTNLCFALAADDVDVAGTNALDGEPDGLFVHSGLYGAYLGGVSQGWLALANGGHDRRSTILGFFLVDMRPLPGIDHSE